MSLVYVKERLSCSHVNQLDGKPVHPSTSMLPSCDTPVVRSGELSTALDGDEAEFPTALAELLGLAELLEPVELPELLELLELAEPGKLVQPSTSMLPSGDVPVVRSGVELTLESVEAELPTGGVVLELDVDTAEEDAVEVEELGGGGDATLLESLELDELLESGRLVQPSTLIVPSGDWPTVRSGVGLTGGTVEAELPRGVLVAEAEAVAVALALDSIEEASAGEMVVVTVLSSDDEVRASWAISSG